MHRVLYLNSSRPFLSLPPSLSPPLSLSLSRSHSKSTKLAARRKEEDEREEREPWRSLARGSEDTPRWSPIFHPPLRAHNADSIKVRPRKNFFNQSRTRRERPTFFNIRAPFCPFRPTPWQFKPFCTSLRECVYVYNIGLWVSNQFYAREM